MRHLALAWPRDESRGRGRRRVPVRPRPARRTGRRAGREASASCMCRAGRWVDWWRSVRYRKADGSFHARGATPAARRRRARRCPRRSAELPLLARAGSVLPLLPADVDTLAPYGRDLVHLRDRRGRLSLLAFPRGRWRGRDVRGRAAAIARDPPRVAAATCRVSAGGATALEAALGALRHRFVPARVMLDGRQLPRRAWSFSARREVLRVRFSARRATLVVRAAGRSAPGA